MTATVNLFAALPTRLPAELVTTLLEAADVRIERIVSHGHASPEGFWYDQEQHEWVVLLTGAAKLKFVRVVRPVPVLIAVPEGNRHDRVQAEFGQGFRQAG